MAILTVTNGESTNLAVVKVTPVIQDCFTLYQFIVTTNQSDSLTITLAGNHYDAKYTNGGVTTSFADTATFNFDTTVSITFLLLNSGISGVFSNATINITNNTTGNYYENFNQRDDDSADCFDNGGDARINDIILNNLNLEFTGVNGAFNGPIDLSSIKVNNTSELINNGEDGINPFIYEQITHIDTINNIVEDGHYYVSDANSILNLDTNVLNLEDNSALLLSEVFNDKLNIGVISIGVPLHVFKITHSAGLKLYTIIFNGQVIGEITLEPAQGAETPEEVIGDKPIIISDFAYGYYQPENTYLGNRYVIVNDPLNSLWEGTDLYMPFQSAVVSSFQKTFEKYNVYLKGEAGYQEIDASIGYAPRIDENDTSAPRLLIKDYSGQLHKGKDLGKVKVSFIIGSSPLNNVGSTGRNFEGIQSSSGSYGIQPNVLLQDFVLNHSSWMEGWFEAAYGTYLGTIINSYTEILAEYTEQVIPKITGDNNIDLLFSSIAGNSSFINTNPNTLYIASVGNNSLVRIDNTNTITNFYPYGILVTSREESDNIGNTGTSYGFGTEFNEETKGSDLIAAGLPDYGAAEVHQQSPAVAIVAAKLKWIRNETNAPWRIIRQYARSTASNANNYNIYRGFGVIDKEAAKAAIITNYLTPLSIELGEYQERISPFSGLLNYNDKGLNTPVTKNDLENFGVAKELLDLSDVNTSTPTNRNILVADGVDWKSRPLVEADISDLTHTAPSTGLQEIDEGNGIGWRLKNSDPLTYGNIGVGAIDFTQNDPSLTYGATGSYSFAAGSNTIASNYNSVSMGYLIDNNGIGSFNSGFNQRDRGYTNFLTGIGHDVESMNVTVVGQASKLIREQYADFNATPSKKLFVIGNGTIANNDTSYSVLTRSNAFEVLFNGDIIMPSYGGGTQTGVATHSLAVDSSGKIIEGALVSGGVTDHTQLTNIGVKTHAQLDAQVDLNNAKVGITPTQASDIITNNAKISYPGDQDLSGYLPLTGGTVTGAITHKLLNDEIIVEGSRILFSRDRLTVYNQTRLQAVVGASNVVTLPASTGTLALTSDITTDTNLAIATSLEVNTGTDNTKAISPLALAGSQLQSDVITNNAKIGVTTEEQNVNADWNAVGGDAEILNKPTLAPSNADNTALNETSHADVLVDSDALTAVTVGNKLITQSDIASLGGGDMLKSTYDTNGNNIVDNSEKVNNLTVETAVPLGALFTDTVYDDTTIQAEQTTQNSAIALNTAKTGITPTQASDIVTNNAKISYPGDQDLSGYLLNTTDTFTGNLNVIGKLGINVASPLNTLSLGNGSTQMGWNFETHTNNTGDYGFNLEASGGNSRILSHTNPSGGNRQVIYMGHSNGPKNVFGISDSSDSGVTYNPRFTVNGNGEVGIGINNPVEKLEVIGYTKSTGFKVTTKTDADVVLAGGGTKLVSDFALVTDLSGYVDLTTAQSIGGFKDFTNRIKALGGIEIVTESLTSLKIKNAANTIFTEQTNSYQQIVNSTGTLSKIKIAYNRIEYGVGTNSLFLEVTAPTTNRTQTYQDADGIIALIGDIPTLLDEDDMASNSDTALATQQSIKAYVDSFKIQPLTGTVIDLTKYSSEYNAITPLTDLTYTFTAGDLGSNSVVYIPSGLATYPTLSGGITNPNTYPIFDNTKEYLMIISTNSNNVNYFFLER